MSDMTPAPVPYRVAYRLCADVIFALADRLRRQGGRKHNPLADLKEDEARKLAELGLHDRRYGGGGLDAALLGYLLAWLGDWQPAIVELEAELADAGRPDALAGIDRKDRFAVCRAVIGGTPTR